MNEEVFDRNERMPLPAGTQIIDGNGIKYVIRPGSVGSGGSSLIYRASRTNSKRLFVVKECYPVYGDGRLTRRNGVVCPTDPDDIEAANYLQRMKQKMMQENAISQRIANVSGRVLAPTEDLHAVKIIMNGNAFDATGSFFIVMEQLTFNASDSKQNRGRFLKDLLTECSKPPDKARPLRNGGLPSPYTVARVMEELLKPLNDIHTAGFIHGDIQTENFFLLGYDPNFGDIGVGILLDFGNARKLEADGKTAPIVDKQLYGTSGFCSPEMFFNNDGTLRLSPATDIFSAGCFLFYLIKGFDFKDTWGEDLISSFSISLPLYDDELLKAGFSKRAANSVKKILTRALEFEPSLRYQNAGEMLTDILELKTLTLPLRFQLAENLSKDFHWIDGSRDAELFALQKALRNPQPMYIWGLWGMGKTSLAIKFAMRQKERGMNAYLVNFRGTMKETVLQMDFANYNFVPDGNGDPQDREYRERLNILRTDYVGSLLIVDGFESDDKSLGELQQENAYKDIINSGLHVLFTTRARPNEYATELCAIDENAAFKLFCEITRDGKENFRPFTPEEEKIIRRLLAEVEYHTLTVELLASLVNESWEEITPQNLLVELKRHQLRADDKSAVIYERVRLLFNLFKFDETYREIFCRLVFLPTEGFDAALWLGNEESAKKKLLRRIETLGWVRRRREDNRLHIHSLIRKVIRDELKPTFADCDKFFARLWQHFENQYPPNISLFKQASELYERAANELQDVHGDYFTHAGYAFVVTGNNARAVWNEDKAIQIREAINHDDLARNYNDISCAYMNLFDTEKALAYLEKARKFLEARESVKPELGNVYANLSVIYSELNQNDDALKYSQAAVELFRKNPPKNKFEEANALTAYGKSLIGKKKYREATDYLREALNISEKFFPPNHPKLALAYLNLSEALALSKNFAAALELANAALTIQEQNLPENHGELSMTYSLLCEIYQATGDVAASKIYSDKLQNAFAQKRLETAKKMLKLNLDLLSTKKILFAKNLETNAGLSKSYRDVAESYRILKDFDGAKKNILTALELTTNDAPVSDNEVLNFFTASEIFDEAGDRDEALRYALQAFDAAERAREESPLLSTCCLRLGILYGNRKLYADALSFYKKYIAIELLHNYPDRDGINLAKFSMGRILYETGHFAEARKLFEEVRADKTAVLPDFHSDVKAVDIFLREINRRTEK